MMSSSSAEDARGSTARMLPASRAWSTNVWVNSRSAVDLLGRRRRCRLSTSTAGRRCTADARTAARREPGWSTSSPRRRVVADRESARSRRRGPGRGPGGSPARPGRRGNGAAVRRSAGRCCWVRSAASDQSWWMPRSRGSASIGVEPLHLASSSDSSSWRGSESRKS